MNAARGAFGVPLVQVKLPPPPPRYPVGAAVSITG